MAKQVELLLSWDEEDDKMVDDFLFEVSDLLWYLQQDAPSLGVQWVNPDA